MQTQKLYYEDSHLQQFTARVVRCEAGEKGYLVTLDATAFYPEGGGQACDLGTLGASHVLDVREQGEQVLHLCDRPLAEGEIVQGVIDWQRRFDLMQQHSGEHIVSGIIHKLFGCHNVGFHMGADVVTIDFDTPIPPEALPRIEEEANMAIWKNLPVRCWYPSPEELPQVAYRTKKQLPWPVRIVEVPDYDSCACCGVHVQHTGEIGLVKLFSCVKFHQGVRIDMACGGRAFAMLSRVYEQNRQVSQAFSAKILETGEAAQRMNEQLAAEKYRAEGLQLQLFARIAQEYAGAGDAVHFEAGLDSAKVRQLADQIADACGGMAAVFSGSDESGYNLCLMSRTADVRETGAALTKTLDGRGGGKPGFFQGSVKGTRAQILQFFREV